MRLSIVIPCLAATTGATFAQGLPSSLVSDSAGDRIIQCFDFDQNGDYAGAGELVVFYDDVNGAIPMTNNVGLLRLPSGEVFVTDTSEDTILSLRDLNSDGDALDLGEARVWFDGTSGNPTGVELTSARGMWLDPDGSLWVASANTNGGGNDAIVRLKDINGDGDANDSNEQIEYYVIQPGGSTGDSIPVAVSRGADGAIYYVDTASSGPLVKGVYRLQDLDGSGVIDAPNESTLFFAPPTPGTAPFFWDLGQDELGRFYIADTGNDVIWRFFDTDGNGTIDPTAESQMVYEANGSSLIWEITPASDGSIYLAEDQNPDRLLRLVDSDGDGLFLSPGDVQTIYDETTAVDNIGSPKAIFVIDEGGPIGVAECDPAVPNSTGLPGTLTAFGSTSVLTNQVMLQAGQLPPNTFGIFVVARLPGSVNPPASDGILCLGGPIGRYQTSILNSGASGQFDLDIDLTTIPLPNGTVNVIASDTWRFQAWHRDVNPQATSNFTSVVAIRFTP